MIAFGPFVIDLENHLLLRGKQHVEVRRKVWEVLCYLAVRPGALVLRDELIDGCWDGAAVTPQVLTNVIRELRVALRDDARNPKWVQTVHTEGYRFIGQIRRNVGGAADPVQPLALRGESSERLIFVGRDKELRGLGASWQRTLRGERQLVFIVGDAGIGKSTLVEHFVASLGVEGIRLATGHCLEQHGASEPYLPFLEAIDRLTAGRTQVDASALAALRAYAPTWFVQLPWLSDSAERAKMERSVLGTTPARMLREGRAFFEALADRTPMLLVIEDLHWADASTLDLLTALAERTEATSLMVIATLRSGDAALSTNPIMPQLAALKRRRRAIEIELSPLDRPSVESYLGVRLPKSQWPSTLAVNVERHSGGNPLFLRSVVDQILASEIEIGDNDGLSIELPEDARECVRAYMRKLAPDGRATLEAASVAGAEFFAAEAAAGRVASLDSVEGICNELATAGRFLKPIGETTLPDGTGWKKFSFVHEIYRRAIYEDLTTEHRQQLHGRVARWLEQSYGERCDEVAGKLAAHFEQALEFEKTLEFLRLAAGNAGRRFAYRETDAYLQAAIALLDRGDSRRADAEVKCDIMILRGSALVLANGYSHPLVEETFQVAERLTRELKSPSLRARSLMGLAIFQLTTANYTSARQTTREIIKLGDEDPSLTPIGLCYDAYALSAQGEPREAKGLLERAALEPEVDKGPPFFDLGRMVRSQLASVMAELGESERSRVFARDAVERSRRFGLAPDLAHATVLAAESAILRDDPGEAIEAAEQAIAVSEENGFETFLSLGRFYRAAMDHRARGVDRVAEMETNLKARRAGGDRWQESMLLGLLAKSLHGLGEIDRALTVAGEAIDFVEKTGERHYEAELHRTVGECLISRGGERSRSEGRRSLQRAVEVASSQGMIAWRKRAEAALRRTGGDSVSPPGQR